MLGWKLGLDRMRRLCTLLGMPQNRFASIHVVGTNGKTSVTRMIAALLEAHGVSTGAYVSPHIRSWRERIWIRGEPISTDAFDSAIERAEESAQVADRSAGDEGPVTQFELLTAAAFIALAEAKVEYGVIEAGLGGRLDATNVIPSQLAVLTSVGLDHTEWLGETVEEIATEKVAVLRDHTKLLHLPQPPEVQGVVDRVTSERHADDLVIQLDSPSGPPTFEQRNFMLSLAAVTLLREGLDADAANRVQDELLIPGRAQVEPGEPPEIYDAAHNPDGATALAETLPGLAAGRLVVCCLAVLEGKDAGGIVEALAPAVEEFICTEVPPEAIEGSGRPGGRAKPALELAALCERAGVEAEAISDPVAAWERARELARVRDGVALAAGSHYLLACIWTERPDQSS